MLTRFLIRNIALIDELSLEFGPGLNVLSGETGAGKSIVVDAISLLLGGRADKELIRADCDKAYVEGAFSVSKNAPLIELLNALGIEYEDGEILLSRELTQSGKSVCRINGISTTLGTLKQVSAFLIDIHGQHEHQSLLDERQHLRFLDEFGDAKHQHVLQDLEVAYTAFDAADRHARLLLKQESNSKDRTLLLQSKRQELERAKVQPGEETELQQRLEKLRNADRITRALQQGYYLVYDSGRDADSVLSMLQEAGKAVSTIENYDERFAAMRARLDSLYFEAEDLGTELRRSLSEFAGDEQVLQVAAERLDQLKRLSRKLGINCDDMQAELADIVEELRTMESIEEQVHEARIHREKALAHYHDAAISVTKSREGLAHKLSQELETQLSLLNMSGTRVLIQVTPLRAEPRVNGMDDVRMLLAPNKGEEAKPLVRIASGGEISRLMLALKAISAEHNAVPTMIFDEIDTGISGRTAQVVSEKLWDIARYRQVFCVTHLQQLAAMGSEQYLVEKKESSGRTVTLVRALDLQQRELEISRMISGISQDSVSSLAHAKNLLDEAAQYRSAHPAV